MVKRSASQSPRVHKRRSSREPGGSSDYIATAAATWTAIGSCAVTMGMYAQAIKAYDAALAHYPGALDALLGWSYSLRMGDVANSQTAGLQASLQRLTKAVDQYPNLANSADFFKELAECYILLDLSDQAHQAILQAIYLQPKDAGLFLLQAQILIRTGACAQAAAALTHCLQLLPPLPHSYSASDVETARSAHAELAAIAAADNNIELLIAELTATLLLPPPPLARVEEHVALWCALATAKERANRIPEALEACEQAELAVGPHPRILITHAYLLLLNSSKANAQRAIELLTQVVEAEPQETQPKKELEEEATGDAPGDFLPWCLLGEAYTVLEQPRAAYDAYQVALRRASSLPITWLAVGKLYLELKQLPDALAAYSQGLRLQLNENSPGTATAWDGLSCVYERCDDQLGDAADACSRAASCFRSYGDTESAQYYENKSKKLLAASQGKGPVPELCAPPGVPNYFLRDLVTLLPSERIALVQGHNKKGTRAGPEPTVQKPYESPRPRPNFSGSNVPESQYQTFSPAFDRQAQPEGRPTHTGEMQGGPPIPPQPPSHFSQPSGFPPGGGQPPVYQLAYSYRPDTKLPGPNTPHQLPQPVGRQMWSGPEYMGGLTDRGAQGPPQIRGQFAPPPPNVAMSPPQVNGAPNGPHRSPVARPQIVDENGYPMPGPPGYPYGQYMPMPNGMAAQLPLYGANNWRR